MARLYTLLILRDDGAGRSLLYIDESHGYFKARLQPDSAAWLTLA